MTARDITIDQQHIVVGFNQHRVFNWDISDPKVQVASKTGDEPSIMYYLEHDRGHIICMHRRYNDKEAIGHWEPLTPNSTSMDTFVTILKTIDRELPQLK